MTVYFFKQGNYTKSKDYLLRGLDIDPNNVRLQIGLSSF